MLSSDDHFEIKNKESTYDEHSKKLKEIFNFDKAISNKNCKLWFGRSAPQKVQNRVGIVGKLEEYCKDNLCWKFSDQNVMNVDNLNTMHVPISTIVNGNWDNSKNSKSLRSVPIKFQINQKMIQTIIEVASEGTLSKYLAPTYMENNKLFPFLVSKHGVTILKDDDKSPFIRINFENCITWNRIENISGSIGLIKCDNNNVYQHLIICEETGKQPKASLTIFYEQENKDTILINNKNVDHWTEEFGKMLKKPDHELTFGETLLSFRYMKVISERLLAVNKIQGSTQ